MADANTTDTIIARLAALAAADAALLPWEEASDRPLLEAGFVLCVPTPAGLRANVTELGEDTLHEMREALSASPERDFEAEDGVLWESQLEADDWAACAAWDGL